MITVIDDLIVLGMAVPEEVKDGRRTICLGGYSPSRGFIRIYPCRVDMGLHRWDIIRVEVERNPRDNRRESWKFINSNKGWERLGKHVSKVGRIGRDADRLAILENNLDGCVSVINDRRDSLGIVRADQIQRGYFSRNEQHSRPHQPHLIERPGEAWIKTKRDFPFEPRMIYTCSDCKTKTRSHNQKILEWGGFEWLRKKPDKREQLWENWRLYSSQHTVYLFVGNLANRRTSFLIINVIPVKRKSIIKGARVAKQLPLLIA